MVSGSVKKGRVRKDDRKFPKWKKEKEINERKERKKDSQEDSKKESK